MLDGLPGLKGLNIAHEVVDRHARGARADKVALRWIGKAGEIRDVTYRDLALSRTFCAHWESKREKTFLFCLAGCRNSTLRSWSIESKIRRYVSFFGLRP
jgi:hypothetical protein